MTEETLPEPFGSTDPFMLFDAWYAEAQAHEPVNPGAMCLATLGPDGRLATRMVLLKGHGPEGFVFYTNLASRKADDLAGHAEAALCFYWKSLERQINIEGRTEPIDEATADAYFASRPRGAQIGAWASHQSQPLASRGELEARVAGFDEKFDGAPIPRPPGWSGYRVVPARIEFWHGCEDRLHDRVAFTITGGAWTWERLNP